MVMNRTLYVLPLLAVLCLVPIGVISAQTEPMPSWIRNNAGLWADEVIGDETFLAGIEFLIENGIIKVGTIRELEEENERLRNELLSLQSSQPTQATEDDRWFEVSVLIAPDGKRLEFEPSERWVLERSNKDEYLYRISDVDGAGGDYVGGTLQLQFVHVGDNRVGKAIGFSELGLDVLESSAVSYHGHLMSDSMSVQKNLTDDSMGVFYAGEDGHVVFRYVEQYNDSYNFTAWGHGWGESVHDIADILMHDVSGLIWDDSDQPASACIENRDTGWKISFDVELYVDGNESEVPANVGFTEGGCQRALYTITDGGTAYAEWEEEYPFEVGHFLWIAEFPIRDMESSKSTLYVNGVKSDQFLRHPIEDGATYRLEFTTKAGG